MAKVSQSTFQVNGRQFTRVTSVSGKTGRFSITLPEEVFELLGGLAHVEGHSIHEAEAAWKDKLKEYENAIRTTRRVILYKVKSNAVIWRGTGRDGRVVHRAAQISFCDQIALLVWAGVYDEHEITLPGGKLKYKYEAVSTSLKIGGDDDYTLTREEQRPNQIPWSKEREEFFLHIITSMEELILKLAEVVKAPEVLLDFIDSGRLLPLGKGTQEAGHRDE